MKWVACALLCMSSAAWANDGPQPYLVEAYQGDGRDVHVIIKLAEHGEPGLRDSLSLGRDGKVVDQRAFQGGFEDVPQCDLHDEETNCEEGDTGCVDCDGDGFSECPSACAIYVLVDWVDSCVPEGEHLWTVGEITNGSSYIFGRKELTVAPGDCDQGHNACASGCDSARGSALPGGLAAFLLLVAAALLRPRRSTD